MNEECLLRLMEHALQEEYDKYGLILELSREQLEELQRNEPDTDKVANLMKQKMAIIGEIQSLENQHLPVKERWECEYGQYTTEERSPVALVRDLTMQLLERIHGIEGEIAENIKRCEADINRKLSNLHKNRNASQAYFAYERRPSRYIDKRK